MHKAYDNFKYIFKGGWVWNKKQMLLFILDGILGAIVPFCEMLIPSIIIYLLMHPIPINQFMALIMGIFLFFGLLKGYSSYLLMHNETQYVGMRISVFNKELNVKVLTTDIINVEPDSKQKINMRAKRGLSSNHVGPELYSRQMIIMLTNIISLLLYSIVIGNINIIIIVILLLVSCINCVAFQRAYKVEYKNKEHHSNAWRKLEYLIRQSFDVSVGKDIRIYQLQDWLNNYYQKVLKEIQKLSYIEKMGYFKVDILAQVLEFLRDGFSYTYLIYLLINGLDLSLFILYLGAISGFSKWFTKIIDTYNLMKKANNDINDIRKYLDLQDDKMLGKSLLLNESDGFEIVMENVSFKYPETERYIFKNLNLKINNHEKVALVGINGAGKTTIVKLLCGLYKADSGRILVNGTDINELNMDAYIDKISSVFQDAILLSLPLWQNVTFKKEQYRDMDKVIECCKLAGIHDKIMTLKSGYDTYLFKDIVDDGIQLSGGQVQKLLLARALYKGGQFLILDEPTAALDSISESEMYENYSALANKKTSLFISHRLASTRFCDRIIFVENGVIIESGTHDELIKYNGQYAHMYEVQAQYYKEVEKKGDLTYEF